LQIIRVESIDGGGAYLYLYKANLIEYNNISEGKRMELGEE